MASQQARNGLKSLIDGTRVRRTRVEGEVLYAIVDAVSSLAETAEPGEYWNDLKQREPALASLAETVEFSAENGKTESLDAVRFEDLLRIVQSIPSRKVERIKRWLARSARQRIEEAENPELAVLRTRKLYERRGYSPRWVDKRLRGVSARHELTGEWFKRGATESEQFRTLTNEMTHAAFGFDVESYRRYKSLSQTRFSLRDHMSDLELALTSLAENLAVALHRERNSQGFEALLADAKDAGEIVAKTREAVEGKTGKPVPTPLNRRIWWSTRDGDGKQVA